MPWHIAHDVEGCSGWAVVKDSDSKVVGCHPTKEKAQAQLAALNIHAKEARMDTVEERERPPRDNIVRAIEGGFELRESENGGLGVLRGHFAKFDEWAEIDSEYEGHFMERIAPGAFKRTFEKDQIRALFRHGRDPQIGDKVLGPLDVLREDDDGGYYEVPLLDTSYNRDLLPGLKQNLYGSSFRGNVTKEDYVRSPERSDHNPSGLPERTIQEFRCRDVGPCTFPAYAGTSAGVMRSLTDEFLIEKFTSGPGLEKLAAVVKEQKVEETGANPAPQAARTTPVAQKGADVEVKEVNIDKYTTKADLVNRQQEIEQRVVAINAEYVARALSPEAQTEWDNLNAEHEAIVARVTHLEAREARVARFAANGGGSGNGNGGSYIEPGDVQVRPPPPSNPFDMVAVRRESRTAEEEVFRLRDNAKRVLERATFPHPKAKQDEAKAGIERLLATVDDRAALSRRILATGSEIYKRALGKELFGGVLTEQERAALALPGEIERALSLTGSAGGFAIPFVLDPTILNTSNGVVNPIRQVARVEQITVDEWRGVSSAGITAAYAAEATETTDNAPTLVQPTISTEKAQAFVPFSIEVGMDWDGLQSQMAILLQDAKDTLESDKFTNGSGTNEPFGLLTGVTNTIVATSPQTFTIANLYSLQSGLPPRYRARGVFMGDLGILNLIRQFDTAGGASLWVQLGADVPGNLLGRPAYENSAMPDTPATSAKFLVFGDFSRYIIVDRIGLNVEVISHLVGTNHRPTGQRGLYAYWRNGAKVVDANAFRALLGVA